MKLIWTAFLCVMLLAGCAGTVKVEKTTTQLWYGGAEGSGGGKNYKVYVSKSANIDLKVDQVWIGDREKGWLPEYRLLYKDVDNRLRNHEAPKGVTMFTVEFAEIYPGEPHPRGEVRPTVVKPFDHPPLDLPASFDKGVAVYCHVGKEARVWVITEMEALEPLYYP